MTAASLGRWAALALGALAAPLAAQEAPALLAAMAGTWDVESRTWAGPDAAPAAIPPAVAERDEVGGFLQEVMTGLDGGAGAPFTRTSILNRNATSGRFEYVSLDTRAPQQMTYQSDPGPAGDGGPLALRGGLFVAADWGGQEDVAFAYRLEVGPVEEGRQVVRLSFTPQGGDGGEEFLSTEYVYHRRP